MNGVFWDVPPDAEKAARAGTVTLVTGRVRSYRNALQIGETVVMPSGRRGEKDEEVKFLDIF